MGRCGDGSRAGERLGHGGDQDGGFLQLADAALPGGGTWRKQEGEEEQGGAGGLRFERGDLGHDVGGQGLGPRDQPPRSGRCGGGDRVRVVTEHERIVNERAGRVNRFLSGGGVRVGSG